MSGLAGVIAAGLGQADRQAFDTALVITWATGDRTVSIRGTTSAVSAYEAGLAAAGIAPGDTALVLIAGRSITVLCKLADA